MFSQPRIVSLLEMLLTYARAFAVTSAALEFERGQLKNQISVGNTLSISKDVPIGQSVLQVLHNARELCESIPSLRKLVIQLDRVSSYLDSPINPVALDVHLVEIQHSLHTELRDHYYFAVTPTYAEIYGSAAPFGQTVFDSFPSAIVDIQNAGKCLAFNQATATVFHLMRAMEVSLKALSKSLGVEYANSWERYIEAIDKKLRVPYKDKPATWKKKEAFYRDILGDLTSVKWAWRNGTMNIDSQYDPEEANEIWIAVKRFMSRLASGGIRERGRRQTVTVALA